MTALQGTLIQLRPWQSGDEMALAKYANNAKISAYLFDRFPYPYTLDDAYAWITRNAAHWPPINLALELDNEIIGGIGLEFREDIYRKTALIGYWLAEPFWGQGIMTEALKLMVNYAFQTFDLSRIQAGVFDSNLASMKVLEKAGFVKEGVSKKSIYKKGVFYDEHIYAILKV